MVDSETSSLQGGRSHRSWTVSTEPEVMESSRRGNGRSSIDSGLERPKTQGGDGSDSAKAGSNGFSRLLNSRRRRKKKTQKEEGVPPVPGIVTEQDLQESRSNESRSSIVTSSNNSSAPPDNEVINLLTDDSEPDRYASPAVKTPGW